MEEVILTFKLFLGHPDPISFHPTPLLPWGGHSDNQSCPLLSFAFPGLRSTEATTSGQRSNTHRLFWVRLYNCQKYSESYISVNFPNIGMKLCAGCRPASARVIGSWSLLSKCWWADVAIPGSRRLEIDYAKYKKNHQLICVLTVDNVKRRQAAVYRQLPPQARIGLGCYGNFSLLEGELSLKSCSLKSFKSTWVFF